MQVNNDFDISRWQTFPRDEIQSKDSIPEETGTDQQPDLYDLDLDLKLINDDEKFIKGLTFTAGCQLTRVSCGLTSRCRV